jgi:hypothetical protein
MPDLTTIYQWHCETAESWETTVKGSKGAEYTVRWGKRFHWNHQDVQIDYSCTCKSYQFGAGAHCKHIKDVIASGAHCNWMQFHDGGDAIEKNGEHHCPKCDSVCRSMGWGV